VDFAVAGSSDVRRRKERGGRAVGVVGGRLDGGSRLFGWTRVCGVAEAEVSIPNFAALACRSQVEF
jgi:hypothetical protein